MIEMFHFHFISLFTDIKTKQKYTMRNKKESEGQLPKPPGSPGGDYKKYDSYSKLNL